MARIRSVHPDICVSETMAVLPAELERTFVRLWTHCDDDGRCLDSPKLIKAAIYPLHDDVTAEKLNEELYELDAAGLVSRYMVGEKRYLQVLSWGEFQHPQRPKKSKFPPPPSDVADVYATRRVSEPETSWTGVEGRAPCTYASRTDTDVVPFAAKPPTGLRDALNERSAS
jgi:hypothetical protein